MTPKTTIKLVSRSDGTIYAKASLPKGINYAKKMEEYTLQERSLLVFLNLIIKSANNFNHKIIHGGDDELQADSDQFRRGDSPWEPALDGVLQDRLPSENSGVCLEVGDGGVEDQSNGGGI
jgi:hypothetical protein